jgi:DNA-binding SARP family transcriptional activator
VVHYARAMRFQILGPLEVEADSGAIQLGGQKERLLLALLLARPNQVVPAETLIRGLWGEHPPPTAAKTLQSHVMRLRRALEPDRARGAAGQVLVTREPGYLLRVAPETLDAARFEELTTTAGRLLAAGDAEAAGSLLREALGLWRPGVPGVPGQRLWRGRGRPAGRAAPGRGGGPDRGGPAAEAAP